MWKWDQGRLEYFQYDTLRNVANFILNHDLKTSDPKLIRSLTGLDFSAPSTHSPWRNYSRIFKLCLLVSEDKNGNAIPTAISKILADTGAVTCDEYLHFLVEASSDPSPALSDWAGFQKEQLRYPLCFALKYILAKVAGCNEFVTPITEIIGAYILSDFTGHEDDTAFLNLLNKRKIFESAIIDVEVRQSRESLKFISQISYLHNEGKALIASLGQEDAFDIFHSLNPISGPYENSGGAEIQRLAAFFKDGSEHDFFDYKSTILSDEKESGFLEGSKVKKTHIVIERNSKLRKLYFEQKPTSICDACNLDTAAKYPWVEKVLDLHHILPLSSGTKVDSRRGTLLDDLIPICPTCHRAIHRYYDDYLKSKKMRDFVNEVEARDVYSTAVGKIKRVDCYV